MNGARRLLADRSLVEEVCNFRHDPCSVVVAAAGYLTNDAASGVRQQAQPRGRIHTPLVP
jgi:hypothetical protein